MKNNKGFMLAEVVIVSAVLITTIVGLYSGFANTYKAYEIRSSYYDAKTVYALKNLEDFLIDEMLLNNIITPKPLDENAFSNDYYKAFITEFINTYNMDSIYILEYKKTKIEEFQGTLDKEFQNYIDFYIDKEKKETDTNSINGEGDYSYILIGLTNDGRYSSLRIK